VQSSIKGPQAV